VCGQVRVVRIQSVWTNAKNAGVFAVSAKNVLNFK
jgi:hypothetical protein